jgi:hypothetical protein
MRMSLLRPSIILSENGTASPARRWSRASAVT